MKIFITYLVVVLAVAGIGYFLFQSSKPENQVQVGEKIEVLNQEHITEGSTDHPTYNSNPPTSGWHWPAAAACRAYDAPQPDERAIHNLEHGGIWITYKSTVDEPTKLLIKDLVKRYNNVLTSPRETNDSNIALAAWGQLLKLDNYDEGQILQFISAYMDKGPERVSCAR
jgi:hypothetical protein